jgi:hypothetical protein
VRAFNLEVARRHKAGTSRAKSQSTVGKLIEREIRDDVDQDHADPPGSWPARDDAEAWVALANTALQLETLAVDQAESSQWEATMIGLVQRQLPYVEFIESRQDALSARLRRRKLAQTNLRYKYGFKLRERRLVRRDVREFLTSASDHQS